MFMSKFFKHSTPFFIGFLLLLSEAIEVSKAIQLHTSFLQSSIHSSSHYKGKRTSIKMLAKNDKNNKSKQCIDFLHTGLIGFMNGFIQAPLFTNAVDIQPPVETQTRVIVTRKQADVPMQIRYSQFLDLIQEDRIEKVTFSSDGQRLIATDTDGIRYRLDALPNDPELLATLTQKMVDLTVLPEETKNTGGNNLVSSLLLPGLLFLGFFFLARRGIGGGGFEGLDGMGFAKSSAKIMLTPDTGVTFENVAGCDSAKMELTEKGDF